MYPRDKDQLDAFYRGDMSFRRLWVLVSQLPSSSRTVRNGRWSQTEEFLATLIDQGNVAAYQRSNGKGQKPKPLKRPGAEPEKPKPKKQEQPLTQAQFDGLLTGR